MGFSTLRHQAGRFFILGLLSTTLSGCGVVDWAYRMGDKMPTYHDNRCQDRSLCWKSEQKTHISNEELKMRRAANPAQQQPGSPPAAAPTPSDPALTGMPQPPVNSFAPPAALPELPPARPTPVPPAPPPSGQPTTPEAGLNLPFNTFQPESFPPGYNPGESAPVAGLKPYEQKLPELEELPPTPVEQQIQEMGGW